MEKLSFTAASSSLELTPFGAHIISWKPNANREVMFCSPKAIMDGSKSIRAGVPVVFPQFADTGSIQKHGFARMSEWFYESNSLLDQAGDDSSKTISFTLQDSPKTFEEWPFRFRLLYKITFSEKELEMKLMVENTGRNKFDFTSALHTYLSVGDISNIEIEGLKGCSFVDKTEGSAIKEESGDSLKIDGEVDRIYTQAPDSVVLKEKNRESLEIVKTGFNDTVVWNPWSELCAGLSDMEADGYKKFVCIESATIQEPVVLQPGDRWIGSQILRV